MLRGAGAIEDDQEVTNVIDGIIRNSPVSVSVADPSLPGCPLIAVSNNFLSLSGYARSEIVGRNCRFLNEDCDLDREVRRCLNEVCDDSSGKATFGGKLRNRRKDGSKFTNILRLRSIFLGGRRFVVGIQLDEAHAAVSERDVKELETAVQRRGVLAKWMWSKAPAPSLVSLEEEGSQPGAHVVQRVSVVTQPRLLTPDHHIEDSLVILVAYRLSGSVITGMGEGAMAARICQTVAEARLTATTYREESRLLCGELNSQKAEGFDLGLNPRDYVKDMSHKPTLVVSGSNVPRAIAWAQRAKILVLGSFLNLSALIELIVQQQPMPVVLLCAGQERAEQPCEEHEIFCGYLLHVLLRTVHQPALLLLSDTARQAMQKIDPDDPWLSARRQFFKAPRTSTICAKPGGARDVSFCLRVDRYARLLPWYSPFLRVFVRRRARKLLELLGPLAPPVPSASGPAKEGELPKDRVPNTVPPPEKRNTVRLFLVRHAEYEGELVKGMAGTLDPRLTERGVLQAQGVSELLASEPMEILLFSPMVRTMQTAEIIARPHKDRGLVPEMNRMIAAVNRGDWSGLSPQQVEEHFPGDLKRWQTDPDWKENGGESFNELMSRTQGMLDHVLMLAKARLKRSNGPVAACLVGHSSTVASVVSLVEPGPRSGEKWTAVSTRLKYCSVTLVEFDDNAGGYVQGRVVYVGQVPYSMPREGEIPRAVPAPAPFVPGLVLEGSPGPASGAATSARSSPAAPVSGPRAELPLDVNLQPNLPIYSQVSIVTLPGDISPEHEIENRLVVLIDALRMSSTLVTAMGQGLESAQLFSSVMEVTHAVRGWGSCALLGGEQRRVLIPGFDRDNSPRSYLDGVTEKTALFLTTNGTRALPWVRRSKMLVLGSFLNASAVVRTILAHLKDVNGVVFLCSGTERGTVRSQDDELCAGYLLKTLLASHTRPSSLILDEAAVSVLQKLYVQDSWEAICECFHETPAAEELRKIQLAGDVEFCVQRDRYRDMLPFYVHGLDLFFSHHVHYNIPVRYEAAKRARPSRGISCGDEGVIQVYVVQQDEGWDAFEAERSALAGYMGEVEATRRHREMVEGFDWADVAFVACSPAHGCRVTAECIARSSRSERPVEIYGGLSAVHSGDWAGLSLKEVRENFPGSLEHWHEDPDWRDHGGESLREVHDRAVTTFRELLDSFVARGCQGAIILITHGILAHSILSDSRHEPLEKMAVSWRTRPSQQGAIALVEVGVPRDVGPQAPSCRHGLPEGCRFRVSNVGRGAVPVALSSRISRL